VASPFPSRNRLKARAELRSKKFGLIAALNQYAVPQCHLFGPIPVCLDQATTGNSGQSHPPPSLRFVESSAARGPISRC
jgi:hypothetical protein